MKRERERERGVYGSSMVRLEGDSRLIYA